MTNEELLAEAKRRYPVGTKYINAHPNSNNEYTITNNDIITIDYGISNKGYLYWQGNWAEIISKPEDKPQFEVGKWYKSNCGNFIGKFKELGLRHEWYFIVSEKLTSTLNGKSYANVEYGYTNDKIWTLLTDLSEIQQYLPDGHPDKFNTNIPLIKDGIYVAEFLNEKYKSYSSIFTCLETDTYRNKDRLYLFKDQFNKGNNGTWGVNSYNIRFRNPTTQELNRYFRFTNIPPGYAESLKQALNNNLKTNNNEETGNICKVSRSNCSKIGSTDITRGTAIKSSSGKGKIGSGYCYN